MEAPTEPTEAARPVETPRPSERRRAKRYLDLWERHLSQIAVHGDPPPRVRQTK